jgi:hypothetical protein
METTQEKVDYLSPEYQRNVSGFVAQHVYYCVSHLIDYLRTEQHDLSLADDLLSLTIQPSTEPEYEDEYDEALEHWLISDWLADRLAERGEMVSKDILGLTVWGRQTSGQSIALDCVICDIYNELQAS